ncbi:MAG: alpha/beta fold hydrolase [Alphaproteobacteria bacterium]
MPHATIDGVRLHYRFDGAENAPVVMMSHSLGASTEMWEPQMAALAAKYRVLRYDSRGHGESEASPPPYHFDRLGEDAYALLKTLGLGPVHFVGLSMGGMVGMTLATAHPEMVRSLALCDTMCETNETYRAAVDGRVKTAETEGMGALVEGTLQRWFTPPFLDRNPPILETIRRGIRTTSVPGYVGCNRGLQTLDLKPRIGAIRSPTIVIVGEDDPGTPVAASEVIHRQIAGSELVVLPQASHLSNVEQPEAFTAALLRHLG